jgi:hypothetical protein
LILKFIYDRIILGFIREDIERRNKYMKRRRKIEKDKINKSRKPILFVLLSILVLVLFFVFGNLFNGEKIIKTNIKKGAVVESNLQKIVINEDGKEYEFLINANTKLIGNNEEKLGSVVEITYDEEYNKNEVAVLIDTKTKETTTEENNLQLDLDKNNIKTIIGTLRSDENNKVIFENIENGIMIYVSTDDKTFKDKNITIGSNIEVSYKGDFKQGIIATYIKKSNI